MEDFLEDNNEESPAENTKDCCPDCDFTLENYKKVGRLGCPTCYQHFQKVLAPNLPKLHDGIVHKGRVNTSMLERINHAEILEKLTQRLEQAIKVEDYELAGQLRDEIKTASLDAANDPNNNRP